MNDSDGTSVPAEKVGGAGEMAGIAPSSENQAIMQRLL